MKFDTVRLGEQLYIKGRIGWKGLKKSEYLDSSNFRIINGESLTENGIDWGKAGYISENRYMESPEIMLQPNDILISKDGTIGKIGYVEEIDTPTTVASGIFVIRNLRPEVINTRFIFYFLSSKYFKNFITMRTEGSVIPHLYQKDFVDLEFPLPHITIQNKIVDILNNICNKINLNKNINKNLEAQAQAIFRSWFIDTSASSSWKIGVFSDIIETMIAGDWGKEAPIGNNSEMVYCIRGADIPEVKAGNKGKMPTRYILPKNYPAKHLVDGDLVVEISGGSPTQSTGRIAAISNSLLNRYDKGMVCTNFCKAIKPKVRYSMFAYYYWQYLYDKNVFFSYENGTTGIKNLDIFGFIETEPIILPPEKIVSRFDVLCQSVFNIIFANGLENEQLSTIRDSLLPKLMSGELDVSEIDI